MGLVGLVNVNKPLQVTSRQVVDRVARAAGEDKAGHAGTLDPLASGVLVVCLGWATKLIEYVQGRPKRYRGTFLLGQSSASDDLESEVVLHNDLPVPQRQQVDEAAASMIGRQMQRPPAFSAVKVNGKRAYKLARRGREFEIEPRPVDIYALDVVNYAFPELTLDIHCGQGTYVRSLGRDLAEKLGTVAVMSALERTAVGEFAVAGGCLWNNIHPENIESLVIPPLRAVQHLPQVVVTGDELRFISQGRPLAGRAEPMTGEVAALDEAGNLVAIVTPSDEGMLRIVRNFVRS